MEITEIPRTIRYDFLLVLLGIGLIITPFYLDLLESQSIISFTFLIVGFILVFIGLEYIRYDYELKMDLKELEYISSKYAHIKNLENKKLLNKKNKENMIKKLKDILNKK